MTTLKQDGVERVLQGQTSLEEVMRITQQEVEI
jgi:general secretion pathway protein E